MIRETKIAPSVLSGDFADMGKAVADLARWGGDYVHCDVMDGVYVKNITFGMPMVAAIRKRTEIPLDVHLMITKPERYVERFVSAGADIVTFHPEASDDPKECLTRIKKAGAKCGIVFNPDVSIDSYKELFPLCDVVLVMSVYAGLGGQSFIPECLDRMRYVRKLLDSMGLQTVLVEADGGIDEKNAEAVRETGVEILVAGSSVYGSADPERTIRILRGEQF